MQLTKRGEYALRALIRLGIEQASGRRAVSVSVLADQEKLPFKFLELILHELKQAGFIEKVRGKDGGARLARPSQEITVGEVIQALEGPTAPTWCTGNAGIAPCTCPHPESCGVRLLMHDIAEATTRLVTEATIADLACGRRTNIGVKKTGFRKRIPNA